MKIGFYKDEDEGSKTKGMYWLVVNGHGPLYFTEPEFNEVLQIAKMIGFAGHTTLRDWLRRQAPSFYAQAITDSDPQGIVSNCYNFCRNIKAPSNQKRNDLGSNE